MAIIEYHLVYDVKSPGEVEDIEQRLRATDPDTMDSNVLDDGAP